MVTVVIHEKRGRCLGELLLLKSRIWLKRTVAGDNAALRVVVKVEVSRTAPAPVVEDADVVPGHGAIDVDHGGPSVA